MAADALARALRLLHDRGDEPARRLRARIGITGAWTELEVHGLTRALESLELVRQEARALDSVQLLALSHVQEGVVQVRVGGWRAALDSLAAIPADAPLDPSQWCALHINRGLAHLGLAESAAATAALGSARDLAVEHGLVDQEFKARHNLACLAFVDGDLPAALTQMREVDAMDTSVSRDRARLDYAEVLLEAGLVDAARRVLLDALERARADGHRLEEGEIALRVARCDLLGGDLDAARHHVGEAAEVYRSRQAAELERDAALLLLTVDVAAGHDPDSAVRRLRRLGDGASPTTSVARETARLEAEARVLTGDVDGAEAALDRAPPVAHEPLAARLQDVLVRSRIARSRGRADDAARLFAHGSRMLAAQQFQSSSLELRASLALHAGRLGADDVARAVEAGDPLDLLTTTERWRAISHRLRPAAVADDPGLAALTRELRRLRQLDVDGPADPDAARRAADLEAEIAEREWSLSAHGAEAPTAEPLAADEARAAVLARTVTVLELVESAGLLRAVVLGPDRLTTQVLGTTETALALATRLRRDLRARATVGPASPMRTALQRATASSLRALDDLLGGLPGEGRLVVVPSGSLAAVPWGLLPSARGRPVTVSPSLTRWVRGPGEHAGDPPRWPLRALHGPGLAHTAPEVAAVRAAWGAGDEDPPGGPSGSPATSAQVVEALRGARVVHLAAHGTHERDSPLFSAAHMADGPLFARELPHPVTSEHVTLAACDVGQFSTRPGDEPLGLATALLALGATSVLAAVSPVADDLAAQAMVDYHRRLAAGADAAEALCLTVQGHPEAGAFCLYGSDWSAPPAAEVRVR